MFGKLQELHPTRWAATFCGLVVLMVSAVAHSDGATPPNILLLVAEDLGARLGSYGDEHAKIVEAKHIKLIFAVSLSRRLGLDRNLSECASCRYVS